MAQDFAPLLRQDWAYLGQSSFINNAVLSVSQPRSSFITAYLAAIAAHGLEASQDHNVYKYGPSLLHELFDVVGEGGTFHVLPTCFFDGGWSAEPGSIAWDDFFTRPASVEQVAYLIPNSPHGRTFAYHWHGRWENPIKHGSLAE